MNLNDNIVYRCLRLGPLRQRHPSRSRSLVRHHDSFHLDTPLNKFSPTLLAVSAAELTQLISAVSNKQQGQPRARQ
jgi:hypothetical protein